MRETWVRSLGQEDPLQKEMATHSSILAWRIPWMEEPGRLQSMGSQKIGQDWETSLFLCIWATGFSVRTNWHDSPEGEAHLSVVPNLGWKHQRELQRWHVFLCKHPISVLPRGWEPWPSAVSGPEAPSPDGRNLGFLGGHLISGLEQLCRFGKYTAWQKPKSHQMAPGHVRKTQGLTQTWSSSQRWGRCFKTDSNFS